MNLDQWMQANSITNTELAAQLGVSQPFIGRIRRGERQPSLPVAVKLSRITKLPVSAFIRDAA